MQVTFINHCTDKERSHLYDVLGNSALARDLDISSISFQMIRPDEEPQVIVSEIDPGNKEKEIIMAMAVANQTNASLHIQVEDKILTIAKEAIRESCVFNYGLDRWDQSTISKIATALEI